MMDEFSLIDRFFCWENTASHVALSVGDDCALFSTPSGYQLAVSVDTALPDVHFFSDAPADWIAQRTLRIALSDLAAMGAKPVGFLLALSLPNVDEPWLSLFSKGLKEASEIFHCPLIGGDTVRGPLSISMTVHGLVEDGLAMTRSAAKEGDLICVSGTLGDAAAALTVLKNDTNQSGFFSERYYFPEPRFQLGEKMRDVVRAAVDISDGLLADLGHICSSSRLGASIDIGKIPCSSQLNDFASVEQKREWVLYGGDDYELCFTVRPDKLKRLQQIAKLADTKVSVIGCMEKTKGVRDATSGALIPYRGYQHFNNEVEHG